MCEVGGKVEGWEGVKVEGGKVGREIWETCLKEIQFPDIFPSPD